MSGKVKLSPAQRKMLAFYERTGRTTQADPSGSGRTWCSLVGRGLLRRSHGLGLIETEITEAGRQLLQENDHG